MTPVQKSESPVAAGQVAYQNTESGSIVAPTAAAKDFATAVAKFAIKGHVLQRNVHADDRRVTFVVRRLGQPPSFTHWVYICAFLAQIGGAK